MSKKILVVDDENLILNTLSNYLSHHGFEVIPCPTGEEALNILNNDSSIDAIILDHRMPGISGAEVLKTMKKKRMKIPVVYLTGSTGDNSRSFERHVDAFFVKPCPLEKLLNALEELTKEGKNAENDTERA